MIHFLKSLINYDMKLKAIDIELELMGTSLVIQWTRIHLPMQGTRV